MKVDGSFCYPLQLVMVVKQIGTSIMIITTQKIIIILVMYSDIYNDSYIDGHNVSSSIVIIENLLNVYR